MKNTMRKLEIYSFLDYDGIAAHLADMSEKGWLFTGIRPLWWNYRRVEPRRRSFYVSYFPKASEFDPEPTPAQREFTEFCERTGWKLAGTSAQMQVFYNESPDPVPIETDPALEVETIHRAAKRNYLIAHSILLALCVFQLVTMTVGALEDPIRTLARSSAWFIFSAYSVVMALCCVELCAYFLWLRRARRAAEAGEWTRSVSHRRFQMVCMGLVLALSAIFMVGVFTSGSSLMISVFVAAFLGMAVLMACVWGVKALLKRLKAPRGLNRALTFLASVLLTFALVGGVTYGGFRLVDRGVLDFEAPDSLPLEAAQLFDTDVEDWYTIQNRESSLFLTQVDCYQRPDLDRWDGELVLDYTWVRARLPLLTGLVRKEALEKGNEDLVEDGRLLWSCRFEPVDPAPWHADAAYRRVEDGQYRNRWLLFYGDTTVTLSLDLEPTREQMDIVAARLGGISRDLR